MKAATSAVPINSAVPLTSAAPLLQLSGISKSFPGVQALRDVSLRLHRGEILALMGENGAGKSTLIRMLGGAHQPDAGTISIDGVPAPLGSPQAAQRAGIGVIYQELSLIPSLTAVDNIGLGHEGPSRWIRRTAERTQAEQIFSRMGVTIPLDVSVRQLSVAQQQLTEIARGLSQNVRILIMDEPSASLTPQEVQRLFRIMRELASSGIGIIYVSHRLNEIFAIADSVTVLRDGQQVGEQPIARTDRSQLIELMVGRSLETEFPPRTSGFGPVLLEVDQLTRGRVVRGVSFSVRRGEVLGLTGLVGAGRTEVARLLFGADRADSGTIRLDGRPVTIRSPGDAIRQGIALLTEDRKAHGLIPARSARENFSLASLSRLQRLSFVNQPKERAAFAGFVERLRIRIPHQEQLIRNLSGGNQQKVLVARWLQRDAQVVIFDEPTRGIDVGTRQEIYLLIRALAEQGRAVLLISSELEEVLGMCHRILVMHEGVVSGELPDAATATQEQIMELATR